MRDEPAELRTPVTSGADPPAPSPLLVLVIDSLSELVAKGEVTDRYYNPGDQFDEVHIAMTSDDKPDPDALRRAVGDARLVLHNLPGGRRLGHRTLGWRPRLLNRWAQVAVDLA